MKRSAMILSLASAGALAGASGLAGGCARLAVEGGDKPIHIVMDINIKIDQKLDQFFAFEEQAPTAAPATRPAETAALKPSDIKTIDVKPEDAKQDLGATTVPATGGVQ